MWRRELQGVSDPNSYRISCGKATLTRVTVDEIAKILGVRRNSTKLRQALEDARRRIDGNHNCVVAVELLLATEHRRIGAAFEMKTYSSVGTVFWHAYAKLDNALALAGDPSSIARVTKNTAHKWSLADQLTGHPSVHRYLYRARSGLARTALDRQALSRTDFDPMAVIDLELLARRVTVALSRPLLTLELNKSKRAVSANDSQGTSRFGRLVA